MNRRRLLGRLGCADTVALAGCGHCPEWRTCKRLASLLTECPEARPGLERVEAANST